MSKEKTVRDMLNFLEEIQKTAGESSETTVDPVSGQGAAGKGQSAAADVKGAVAGEAATKTKKIKKGETNSATENVEMIAGITTPGDGEGEAVTGPRKEGEGEQKTAMYRKIARAAHLQNLILDKVASELEQQNQKEASASLPPAILEKVAAAQDFACQAYEHYLLGSLQRMQDECLLQESGLSKQAAAMVLDKLAADDPEALAPGAEVASPEGQAEALATELDAAGVPAEEFASLQQAISELIANGVSEQEILEALQELAAEEGGEAKETSLQKRASRTDLICRYMKNAVGC